MNCRIKNVSLIALGALFLSGCATTKTPEDTIRVNAKEMWSALLGGKFDKAYEYVTPSFRKVNSLDRYRGSFGGTAQWIRAEVVNVTCAEATKCTAIIEIAAKPIVPPSFKGTITTQVEETWLLEDGRWWLAPKN